MTGTPLDHWIRSVPKENGVHVAAPKSLFATLRDEVRVAENKVLTDEQVANLPDGEDLWNAEEWRNRARSARRLVHALEAMGGPLVILDVYCGNGWLANLLYQQGHEVLGIDESTLVLDQAVRTFPGPYFLRADPLHSDLPKGMFDVIVLAGRLQYFENATATLRHCFNLLKTDGAIHIMDTVLHHSRTEADAAKARCIAHHSALGFPEMASFCHAHRLADVQAAGKCRVLSTPGGEDHQLARFGRPASPHTHLVLYPQ